MHVRMDLVIIIACSPLDLEKKVQGPAKDRTISKLCALVPLMF